MEHLFATQTAQAWVRFPRATIFRLIFSSRVRGERIKLDKIKAAALKNFTHRKRIGPTLAIYWSKKTSLVFASNSLLRSIMELAS